MAKTKVEPCSAKLSGQCSLPANHTGPHNNGKHSWANDKDLKAFFASTPMPRDKV